MIALADNPKTDRAVAALMEMARASGPASQSSAVASRRFGYDAVEDKDRRKPPAANTKSEDDLLTPGKRKKLTGATRDIHRNFSIAGWAIRKHLDYVSTFSFQSRTGSKELDDRIEEMFAWWMRPANCDVAGRHSLGRLIRLTEARRTVDGDVFLLKLSDGRLQAIEGDRVCTPTRGLPAGVNAKELTHGVQADKAGRPRAYCICKRSPLGGSAFERIVRAAFMEHHGFFDRFDQLRGISPLAPAGAARGSTWTSSRRGWTGWPPGPWCWPTTASTAAAPSPPTSTSSATRPTSAQASTWSSTRKAWRCR